MATVAVQAVQAVSLGWLGLPWIIWSGLIGAAVATLASALTTLASSKNSLRLLAKQHEHDDIEANRQRAHDAKQKDEDRKATIRKEVYTEAVEQTHAFLGHIGSLPDRPLDGNDTDGFQSFLKASAKVWLVADAEAAHLSRDLVSAFGEVFLSEISTAYPIRVAMEPIRRRQEQIAFAEGEVRRLVSQIADAKARNASLAEQTKLGDLAVEARDYVKALESVQQQARADIAPMRLDTFRATFGKLRPVQRSIVKLVSALREELNLPRNDDKFMEQHKKMEQRAWQAVNIAYGIDPAEPMPDMIDPV